MRTIPLTLCIPAFAGIFALVLCGEATSGEMPTLLLDSGSVWEYWDTGETSAKWMSPDFDSSQWKKGAAPLGYGDDGLASQIGFGKDAKAKIPTAYFRLAFTVEKPERFKRIAIHTRFDDGCVLYLNGEEIGRFNLPRQEITHNTPAQAGLSNDDEFLHWRLLLEATKLRSGHNVLAAAVHQVDPASSDLWWQADVKGYVENDPLHPQLVESATDVTRRYHESHLLPAETRIPNGFVDGGRGMMIAEDGSVRSRREVMVVDRERDPTLQKFLKYATSDELKQLSEIDRATRLARFIDKELSYEGSRDLVSSTEFFLSRMYAGQEVLLGDVDRYCGGGVCRHRSLLFKLMADEAGLKATLVRGNHGVGEAVGGHAWNELELADGQRVIVDVMNPQPDFYFPKPEEPALRHYLSIRGEPYYPDAVANAKQPVEQRP